MGNVAASQLQGPQFNLELGFEWSFACVPCVHVAFFQVLMFPLASQKKKKKIHMPVG